jgi:exosortase
MAQAKLTGRRIDLVPLVTLSVLLAMLLWAYWNSLLLVAGYWESPKYSHGYLVPLFTLVLLWLRRDPGAPVDRTLAFVGGGLLLLSAGLMGAAISLLFPATQTPVIEMLAVQAGVIGALLVVQQPLPREVPPAARWAGVGLLAFGLGVRLLATYFPNLTPEMYSFIPATLGVLLIVGGWNILVWCGPPVAFLIFMFPLPSFLDSSLLVQLQKLATSASTYCLQTLGIAAVNESNRIALGEVNMEIIEACSGLRMLTIFGALAVAITMVTDRPWWEKLIIAGSAVPIALAVNIIRITITGIMYLNVGSERAEEIFHALYGWFMMPMAFGLLYVEFQVLTHLFLEEDVTPPVPIDASRAATGRATVASR